jgi:hypothetical protein
MEFGQYVNLMLQLGRYSGAVPHSLPLASSHSDKRFKAPHVVCGWLRERLSEAHRSSFGLSLRSISGTMKTVVV